MKKSLIFVISFVGLFALTFVTLFFLNGFLFFIYGYHIDKNNLTQESFKAYRTIYGTKVVFVVISILLNFLMIIIVRKHLTQTPILLYKSIYFITLLMLISVIFLGIAMLFLPRPPILAFRFVSV